MFRIKMPHHMRSQINLDWDRETKCYHLSEHDFDSVASLLNHWNLSSEGIVAFRDGCQLELTEPVQNGDLIKVSFMTIGG